MYLAYEEGLTWLKSRMCFSSYEPPHLWLNVCGFRVHSPSFLNSIYYYYVFICRKQSELHAHCVLWLMDIEMVLWPWFSTSFVDFHTKHCPIVHFKRKLLLGWVSHFREIVELMAFVSMFFFFFSIPLLFWYFLSLQSSFIHNVFVDTIKDEYVKTEVLMCVAKISCWMQNTQNIWLTALFLSIVFPDGMNCVRVWVCAIFKWTKKKKNSAMLWQSVCNVEEWASERIVHK